MVVKSPWTVALQAPLSLGLSRQEYWSGCHFLLQGVFPGTDPASPACLALAGGFFTAEPPAKPSRDSTKVPGIVPSSLVSKLVFVQTLMSILLLDCHQILLLQEETPRLRELKEPGQTHTAGPWPSLASDAGLLTLKLVFFPLSAANIVFCCYYKLIGRQLCPLCQTPLMRGLICCQVPKCKGITASSPRSSQKVRLWLVCQCLSRGMRGPNQGLHSSSFRENSCLPVNFPSNGDAPHPRPRGLC